MRDALIAALYVVVLVAGVRSGLVLLRQAGQPSPPGQPSRSEPSRSEPSRSEPSRSEPSRSEPSRSEPSRSEPSRRQGGAPRSGDSGRAGPRWRAPIATVAALLIVGVPTALQLTVAPWLLTDLRRDRAAIGDGQVWRLATSLVVQDGGVAGTVFNLLALAIVGAVAEQVWGTKRWIAIALVSGVAAQLWGLIVQPTGAGNSVVVFGLAASMAVAALKSGERALPVACLTGSAILTAVGDIHGGAAVIGALLGASAPLNRGSRESQ